MGSTTRRDLQQSARGALALGFVARLTLTVVGLLVRPALAADVWDDPFPGVRHLHRTGPDNLNIHAAVVDLCAPGVSVRTTAYAERAQRTSTFATAVGAQLAINADFSCRPIDVGPNSPFAPCVGHQPYVTYGLAMHDGQSWPGTLTLDALLAFGADRAQLYDNSEMQPFEPWMREGTGGHFSSVRDGQANGYDCPIDPRTAVGLSKDQTRLIMVVADGRGTWRGLTCREAADLMVELGADRGTGLDSGGSSTMWFSGQGVLNHPSDGSERVVGNHLAVYATGSGAPSHCVQPAPRLNPSAALPAVSPFGLPGRFNGLTPVRLFDTRSRQASANLQTLVRDAAGRVAPGSPFFLELLQRFGLPANATGVGLNLTATDAAAGGYATVWPAGLAQPAVSSVNFSTAGSTTNSALLGLGPQGALWVNSIAAAHFIGDLQGYFAPTGAGFVPGPARRLLDTRSDAAGMLKANVSRVIVPPGSPLTVAFALNVTATQASVAGLLTVYPCDQQVPATSSLNFGAQSARSAAVLATTSAAGVCALANVDVHLIVDAAGTFEAEGGLDFQAVAPVRLLDTRESGSPWVGRTARQAPQSVRLDTLAGLPAQTRAVALNVTVTGAVDDGFAAIYPCASGLPATSNLNFTSGQTVGNMALVGLGDGEICLVSSGRTHVIIDLMGAFFAAPQPHPLMPASFDAGPDADAGVASGADAGNTLVGGCGCNGAPPGMAAAFALLMRVVGGRRVDRRGRGRPAEAPRP